MRYIFGLSLFFISLSAIQAQNYNLNLLSNLDYPQDLSDIWGYVDDNGVEYAIMGAYDGTLVISLEDYTNPTEILFVPGGESVWRDMKTYNDFAYITTDVEAQDGILIIDLRDIENNNLPYSFYKPNLNINGNPGVLRSVHNLYIDEAGFMYLSGANLNDGGLLIFDLNDDPNNPTLVGIGENIYSHDVYARGNYAYSSNVNDGHFSIIDISDKSNPTPVVYQSTSFDFTHNAWLSDDGNYLFTTDELPNANIDAYDISDIQNIKRVDMWHPKETEGTGVIPHNVHVFNDYLVISHYTDGLKVLDASRPHNLIEVASYDTYTGNLEGTWGCWGAYPFLPSGKILASDIKNGLFVFDINYQRACFLEGNVVDASNQVPLNGVTISIQSPNPVTDLTASNGDYAMGQVTAGTFNVTYSKPGYVSKTISVELINGQVNIQNIQLAREQMATAGGNISDANTGNPIENAVVRLQGDFFSYDATTNSNGDFMIDELFQGDYEVYAGKWGFTTEEVSFSVIAGSNNNVSLELSKGYEDPFAVDLGWTIDADALAGNWDLGEPIGTFYQGFTLNPEEDTDDLGNWCYVTGNSDGNPFDFDVDNGTTTITSPVMDLTSYVDPRLTYQTWFVNGGGNGDPDDALEIRLISGNANELVANIVNSNDEWTPVVDYRISDIAPITTQMRLQVITSDLSGTGHIVEAGFDNFRIYDNAPVSTNDLEEYSLEISPVPFRSGFSIRIPEGMENGRLNIFDISGKLMFQLDISNNDTIEIPTSDWTSGIYQVHYTSDNRVIHEKVVKQ